MSDDLASVLAELRRRLDAAPEDPAELSGEPRAATPAVDLWSLSELELDREMARRLERLHALLPPAAEAEAAALAGRRGAGGWLRRRLEPLRQRLRRWLVGPQRDLDALLIELGLAAYVRQRLQEARLETLADRVASDEEDLVALRQRIGPPPGDGPGG